ncbi:metallophosphoesterase family protein [Deinococcus koreensis]|uniref:metallophosphoesterase family protein n=1 Tax=Deinococcus koreensis TaxID=2054903 RepID=UPI0013FE00D7|nr:metallophosphoesterase family protein [Deinococcus koreensis]
MRIGLIADIQGNLHALEAVLAALAHPGGGRPGVDATLCAGDLVGYAAHPNEVVLRVRAGGIPSVVGNQDQAVGWGLPRANRQPAAPRTEILRRAALEWTQGQLHAEHRAYLRGLPRLMRLPLSDRSVTVLHAGIDTLDDWLTPDDPPALEALARRLSSDVVVLGHTHRPFEYRCAGTLFINPGPVGRSVDGDPRASFAVLDLDTLQADFVRLDYDLPGATDAISRSGLPGELSVLIAQGRAACGEGRPPLTLKELP